MPLLIMSCFSRFVNLNLNLVAFEPFPTDVIMLFSKSFEGASGKEKKTYGRTRIVQQQTINQHFSGIVLTELLNSCHRTN